MAPALDRIRFAINRAERLAGRPPGSVTLTAVTKQQPWEKVLPVLQAGQRAFGENRVQEALGRWEGAREAWPGLELRLIGPLQSNKAREAAELFDVIETLDRPSIVAALAREAERLGKALRVLVQVNTGEEASKSGVAPRDADAFIAEVRRHEALRLEGLMCIPPVDEEPAMHFALLRKLAQRNGLSVLSMGMSGDFETAVRFGATHVRVGSALFGAR
ncbi:YggS family pyridoxal phosphate-dependent enzyme [Brevundimonas sp. 2R-24]|uniref:Pyridoxal phosphate homeostasis protein n=2 Tax=Peiella sedimenti TaxID=3061083 RepID=A0ABT8SMM6_9CAUL|nr:YggS family pyridoxal phosphate-dependent enzyme [Caulobacteraceae bacterium XZ-24]